MCRGCGFGGRRKGTYSAFLEGLTACNVGAELALLVAHCVWVLGGTHGGG